MLWEKESNNADALYVNIFKNTRIPAEDMKFIELSYQATQKVDKKNNAKSQEHRKIGNELFAKNKFAVAIEEYNRALQFAENGTHYLGLAYANRSTCFLHMKMYNECLVDIELAKNANYPTASMDKLEKRKSACEAAIANEQPTATSKWDTSFVPNEKFPCMANMLQIERNNEYGRYITTNSDIDVGKTIFNEEGYITMAHTGKYFRCDICLKLMTNFVPCKNCTTGLFCHGACVNNEIHKYECNMSVSSVEGMKEIQMQIARSILIAFQAFSNSEELMDFVEDVMASDATEIPEREPTDPKMKYRMFLKCSNRHNFDSEIVMLRVYSVYQSLMKQRDICAKFNTEKHQRFLMHLVKHHANILITSSAASIEVSGAIFTTEIHALIASFFNHSCAPNVVTICVDNRIIGITIRPIKAGDQLFISYFGRKIIALNRIANVSFLIFMISIVSANDVWFQMFV